MYDAVSTAPQTASAPADRAAAWAEVRETRPHGSTAVRPVRARNRGIAGGLLRRGPLVAVGLLVPTLVVGGAAAAQAHKSVDLVVDGEATTVSTFAGSVSGLLEQEGIELGEHDVVAPGPDEALATGAQIEVLVADEITAIIDGAETTFWTTARTADELLTDLSADGSVATVAAARTADGRTDVRDMPVVADGEVEVLADGVAQRLAPTGEDDAFDVLAAAGVPVGKLDTVTLAMAEDGTPQVVVARESVERRDEAVEIPFQTVNQDDPNLFVGETRVVQEGVAGEVHRVVRARIVDGQEVSAATRETVTREPVHRIVSVGTKERPAPEPAPEPAAAPAAPSARAETPAAPAPAAAAPANQGSAPSSRVWAQLAQCESGGNPSIVSSNGLYHGLYQFSVQTWQAVGGSGLPSQASAAEQTKRAQILQERSGWGQWPACSRKLGLR